MYLNTKFNQLLAVTQKECLLLVRDKIGLLILFLMPAIFVVLITLVQFSNTESTPVKGIILLVVNEDHQGMDSELLTAFQASRFIHLETQWQGKTVTQTQAEELVRTGEAQGALLIPKGATENLTQQIKKYLIGQQTTINTPLRLMLNTSLPPFIQTTLLASMDKAWMMLQLKLNQQILSGVLGTPIVQPLTSDQLIVRSVVSNQDAILPNVVQQNVPAWAIFGMFFIIVPLANVLIGERNQNVFQRALMTPVSMLMLLSGKMLSYLVINALQLTLILVMGKTVLPWLGTPALAFGSHIGWMILTGFCISLAAIGTGFLLGAIFKTEQQVSMFAPLLIVISAAIGGVMVPLYLMPAIFQQLSWLSPLRWGLDAFIDLFVQGLNVENLMRDLGLLLLFFIVTIATAIFLLARRLR